MVDPQQTIGAIERLKSALEQFAQQAGGSMDRAFQTYKLAEGELSNRELALNREAIQAQIELDRCEQSGTTDEDGRYIPPDCRREEAELESIRQKIEEARRLHEQLGEIFESYRAEQSRLQPALDTVPKAAAWLQECQASLGRFNQPTGGQIPGSGFSGSGPSFSPASKTPEHQKSMPVERREGNRGPEYEG